MSFLDKILKRKAGIQQQDAPNLSEGAEPSGADNIDAEVANFTKHNDVIDDSILDDVAGKPISFTQDQLDILSDYEYVSPDDKEYGVKPANNEQEFLRNLATASVLQRNAQLNRDIKGANKRVLFLIILIICLSVLLAILVSAFVRYPKTVFIPTKDNSAICEVNPESNPYLNDVSVAEFARDGVLNLYSVNFTNWQQRSDQVFNQYFTSDGTRRTVSSLSKSGLIDYIDKNALSLKASSTNTTHVESKGIFNNGEPYWTVTFPFIVEVYSGDPKKPIDTKRYNATVRVVSDRAAVTNPKGLGIDSVALFEPN